MSTTTMDLISMMFELMNIPVFALICVPLLYTLVSEKGYQHMILTMIICILLNLYQIPLSIVTAINFYLGMLNRNVNIAFSIMLSIHIIPYVCVGIIYMWQLLRVSIAFKLMLSDRGKKLLLTIKILSIIDLIFNCLISVVGVLAYVIVSPLYQYDIMSKLLYNIITIAITAPALIWIIIGYIIISIIFTTLLIVGLVKANKLIKEITGVNDNIIKRRSVMFRYIIGVIIYNLLFIPFSAAVIWTLVDRDNILPIKLIWIDLLLRVIPTLMTTVTMCIIFSTKKYTHCCINPELSISSDNMPVTGILSICISNVDISIL